jgi:hypothetical protein
MPSSAAGNIGQVNVGRAAQSVVGGRAHADHLDKLFSMLNDDPLAAEVRTLTVTGATNAKTYTYTIDGVSVSYTSDATATVAEIADGLAAQHNITALAYSVARAASDGVSVVTFTARNPGRAFVLAESDAQMTTALVTAAATADDLAFGRLLIANGYDSNVYDESLERCKLAASADFTQQVMTFTPTYVASAEVGVTIIDRHSDRVIASFFAVSDTDLADLIAELVAGLNAQLPANSVLAADAASAAVTLTAEVAGLEFDAYYTIGDQGASLPTATMAYTTGPSIATSILHAARGITYWDASFEADDVGSDAVIKGGDIAPVIGRGKVFVENSQTIVNGGDVYVELGVAADNGKLFNTNSATRLLIPFAKWKFGSVDTAIAAIAEVELSL